jgi:spermidine synthase
VAPDHPTAQASLAGLLLRQGLAREATDVYRRALRVTPYNAGVHTGLALSLRQIGEAEGAAKQFQIALTLNPEDVVAQADLAWIRATSPSAKLRDGAQAVQLAEQACTRSGRQDAGHLDVLAAAYAEAGRFGKAQQAAKEALELARAAGPADQAPMIERHLRAYQAKQPWRESTGE